MEKFHMKKGPTAAAFYYCSAQTFPNSRPRHPASIHTPAFFFSPRALSFSIDWRRLRHRRRSTRDAQVFANDEHPVRSPNLFPYLLLCGNKCPNPKLGYL